MPTGQENTLPSNVSGRVWVFTKTGSQAEITLPGQGIFFAPFLANRVSSLMVNRIATFFDNVNDLTQPPGLSHEPFSSMIRHQLNRCELL